ncbi:MucR family transcriptional regulator [Agaricicola taiwanensis]|uniref:MucR family transcriptional regulator n=1 Tax=Agaricicola taiwanensis TaxID=591372 RepID=A0A8J2YEV4_9RHOB|nr:MucR family transcriptional regulator [Agaricicola taiwanensis]GGE27584.1 MucR family transcriptional regulator [Agaricicola taiwanensis]
MLDQNDSANYVELAADIVSAYVSNNTVAIAELPELVGQVHAALKRISTGEPEKVEERLTPAVPVKKSVTPDYIISLEDGQKFKSLKRHLRTKYNMTPDDYRKKWGLPADYPMVAPNYAASRSDLARKMGLGQKREEEAPAKPTRGRKKATA